YGSSKVQALVDSDIVVVPFYYVSVGITAVEASFCGKPVVAANVGGLREVVIDGKNGFLCRKGNVDELAEVLEKAFGRWRELKQMGEYGQKFAISRYSALSVGNSIVSVYS